MKSYNHTHTHPHPHNINHWKYKFLGVNEKVGDWILRTTWKALNNFNQLTFMSIDVSSSGVRARDDFRWPKRPLGALAVRTRKSSLS